MKDRILKYLREKQGYVSGQDIADNLGVSRAYIWKSIDSLRKEGYVIDSVSNKGYRLLEDPDSLKHELEDMVEKSPLVEKLYFFDTIDSTNTFAKSDEIEYGKNALVYSQHQTKGRGRLGRNWVSDANKGIYMSLCLFPDFRPDIASRITQLTALAVQRALEKQFDLDFRIKWPNDIFLGERKICGILTEMTTELDRIQKLIIGVGINTDITFEGELELIASSIASHTKKKISNSDIVESFLKEFNSLYEDFIKFASIDFIRYELNRLSNIIGKEVKYISAGKEKYVTALEIDSDGNLIVTDGKETEKLSFGEVSIRLNK